MIVVAWLLVVYVILSLLFICFAVYTDDDDLFVGEIVGIIVVCFVVFIVWLIDLLAL